MAELVFVESRSYNPSSYARRLCDRDKFPRKRKLKAIGASRTLPDAPPEPLSSPTPASRMAQTSQGLTQGLRKERVSRPARQEPTPTPSAIQSERHESPPRVIRAIRRPPSLSENPTQQHSAAPSAARDIAVRSTTPPYGQDCPLAGSETSSPEPSPEPSHGPSPRKRARGNGLPDGRGMVPSSNISHRREAQGDGLPKIQGKGVKCGVCAQVKTDQQQCQSCNFSLCRHCVVNAALVHPEHVFGDHPRGARVPAMQAAPAQCDVCGLDLGAEQYACQQCRDTYFCPFCRHLHPAHHTLTLVAEQAECNCDVCGRDLPGIRYECQDCSISFCVSCRHYHPAGHTLYRRGPGHAYENGHVIEEVDDEDILDSCEVGGVGEAVDGNMAGGENGSISGGSDGEQSQAEERTVVRHRTTTAAQDKPVPRRQQQQMGASRPRITITMAVEGVVSAEEIAKGLMRTAQQLLYQHKGKDLIDGTRPAAISRQTGQSSQRRETARLITTRDNGGSINQEVSEDGNEDGSEDGSDDGSNDEARNPLNDCGVPEDSSMSDPDPFIREAVSENVSIITRRRWDKVARKRLRELMGKGWDPGRVAATLGRTPSAVKQQWRKEKASQAASHGRV